MEYKNNVFDSETIPDYALQPARPEEEFDAAAYDHLYRALSDEKEALPMEPEAAEDAAPVNGPAPFEAEQVDEQEDEGDLQSVEEKEAVADIETADTENIKPVEVDAIPVSEESAESESDPGIVRKDKMPTAVPVSLPVYEKIPVKLAEASGRIEKNLNFTDLCKHKPVSLHVEEDVLIPDVKPDMKDLLYIEGRLQMSMQSIPFGSVSIKAEGDIIATTLYMPEEEYEIKGPISLETRIPFREDAAVDASPDSQIVIEARVESIDVERINERKFRIKADVLLILREYRNREIKMFEGLENEEIECRHEGIKVMDVAFKKTETFELSEELRLKDDMPDIDMILLNSVNVVENHKQINREKAVIDATVFLNILYKDREPVFYQGKLEFTQFIKIDDEKAFFTPLLGSRTAFSVNNLSIQPKKDDQGNCRIFDVSMNVDTDIEYYRELEDAAVVDLYHLEKEAMYETEVVETKLIYGNSVKEATGREIVNIPEHLSGNPKVIYLSGKPELTGNYAEDGRCIVEGVIPVSMICQSAEGGGEPYCLSHKLDFRTSMDFPNASPDMEPDTELSLKELWFDSINSRQIEVNAGISVSTNLFGKRSKELVRSVSLVEPEKVKGKLPDIIVYVASPGDTAWKVAKKYQMPVQKILESNELESSENIKGGAKLIILA